MQHITTKENALLHHQKLFLVKSDPAEQTNSYGLYTFAIKQFHLKKRNLNSIKL